MIKGTVLIRSINPNGFRPHEWATIMGVVNYQPPTNGTSRPLDPRPAYQVVYGDMFVDFIPVSDMANYELYGTEPLCG